MIKTLLSTAVTVALAACTSNPTAATAPPEDAGHVHGMPADAKAIDKAARAKEAAERDNDQGKDESQKP